MPAFGFEGFRDSRVTGLRGTLTPDVRSIPPTVIAPEHGVHRVLVYLHESLVVHITGRGIDPHRKGPKP